MEDVTIILMIATILLYVGTLLMPKVKEMTWLALIVSVCTMGAIILDPIVETEEFILVLIPDLFIFLMCGLKAMGILDKW